MPEADCLFCKIIRKEIPATTVYEDADVLAFLDIKPVNAGHVLVVPKKHSEGFLDADPETLARWIKAAQKIAKAVTQALGVSGFNLMQNNGAVAGQVVSHLHLHIIPRRSDDGLELWHGAPYASKEEAEAVAERIRGAL